MNTERTPGFWSVIPATVMFDTDLRPNEKLLYGIISAMANQKGYCYTTNATLGKWLDANPDTVSRWVGHLARQGHIIVLIDSDGGNADRRKIYLSVRCEAPDEKGGPGQKVDTSPGQKAGTRPGQKVEENNINNTIPPISPTGDGDGLFEKFWQAYPRKVNKKAARKAFDRLHPTEEQVEAWIRCFQRQAMELEAQKSGKDWLQYFPHASTWLNGERWTDGQQGQYPPTPPGGGSRPQLRTIIVDGEEVVVCD